ncbi:MAG TPA: hypothetical protein VES88_07370 [Gemmatimonadaceae bacterium]|nr:hypothetical protein [Gemmatimonadaceae bacterium]
MEAETMKDLTIELENRPGALAEMGEALGRAGVSVEGGGAFVVNGIGVAPSSWTEALPVGRSKRLAFAFLKNGMCSCND